MKAIGEKYDKNLTVTQIAAAFRRDVKAAQKREELPLGLKTSVRCSKFAGGTSIRVNILDFGFNPFVIEAQEGWPSGRMGVTIVVTTTAKSTKNKLDELLAEYNFDNSHTQSDYFDTNFYSTVALAFDQELSLRYRQEAYDLFTVRCSKEWQEGSLSEEECEVYTEAKRVETLYAQVLNLRGEYPRSYPSSALHVRSELALSDNTALTFHCSEAGFEVKAFAKQYGVIRSPAGDFMYLEFTSLDEAVEAGCSSKVTTLLSFEHSLILETGYLGHTMLGRDAGPSKTLLAQPTVPPDTNFSPISLGR